MPKQVKRAALPGASELFRPTEGKAKSPAKAADVTKGDGAPAATGRVRHDQKITVYFSSEELFALEDATLQLERAHGLSLDRGRLVRTAVALALADLAENGDESAVVGELRDQ